MIKYISEAFFKNKSKQISTELRQTEDYLFKDISFFKLDRY